MLSRLLLPLVVGLSLTASAHAQILLTSGTNVTGGNTPIEGLNDADYSHLGTIYAQFEGTSLGAAQSLIDGDYTYGFDTTYSDSYRGRSSFAGIEGSSLLAASTASPITYLQVTFRLFGDGGWYGPNNLDLGGNVPLTPAELTAPVVQTTLNGTDWTTVGSVTDYVAQLTGANHNNNLNSNTVTFALIVPQSDIEGIRIIGSSGGTAGGDNGFVGFTEFTAYSGGVVSTPEPATYALFGIGFLALAAWSQRRSLAQS